MELRHLRYFVVVAEEENVSRAALKLHVSQPGISRQIRDLEAELGFSLLERGAKSVRLTEAGRVFLTEARAVLERMAAAVKAAREVADGSGELHIGYAPSLTARMLPGTLRAFHAELPRVRVKLHDLSTDEMISGLRDKKLELALVVRPTKAMLRDLRFEQLSRDPMRLAVAPNHALARKRAVTLVEAAREPLITYGRKDYPEYHKFLRDLFLQARPKPRVAEEHESVSSLITAVEAGSGVALVSQSLECVAGTRLKLLPLSPPLEPLIIGAAFRKTGLLPAAQRFLDLARKNSSHHEIL